MVTLHDLIEAREHTHSKFPSEIHLKLTQCVGCQETTAFVEFGDRRDALDAIRALDGKNGWHVELSHNSNGGRSNGDDLKCYQCGHFARECRSRGVGSRRVIVQVEGGPHLAMTGATADHPQIAVTCK
ncbi:hypothetical protein L1987_16520 [Smallanthus sonchifolius]|uniref:Uncharacterized protein n=1 Tax=Smallanthus sonchifolius TaxID=185202 RepID=A0ACB9JB80_9ASTR|nr:hypothetical protein L1987_16520 [Smallanthus sonchifolius]